MMFLINQAIDEAAGRYPDQAAICFGKQQLSYADLVRRTNCLARLLRERGVKRGDRVGIYMNKCLESAVAIYGILKAGAAYVPLDPAAPLARIKYVLRDCGIGHIVTHKNKRAAIRQILMDGASVQTLVGFASEESFPASCISWEEVNSTPGHAVTDAGTIEMDLAYILYTSGSTGDPKGIMHTHRSGLSFAHWAAATYSLAKEDRLSNHAPLHFDLSTFDFFAGALAGATTIVIPEEYTKLPASLSKLIADQQISVWYSVPSALIQLLLRGGLQSRDLSALRWILFAGEAFPSKFLRQLMQLLPGAHFSNLYGPTETNVCTFHNVEPLESGSDEPIPIGVICSNAEALVVDEVDKAVVPGEVGELLIRGPIVMRGYWGRPDLNQSAFWRRSFYGDCEDIFYRTGDLVRQQGNGTFLFMGRKDRQVKTRGYRVELDEIEAALNAHSQVEEAAVYTVPDSEGSCLIEAVATLKAGTEAGSSDLIKFISARLPWYAIPARILVLDSIPRTSTGKVDRVHLRAQAQAGVGACESN
jgi:amino acid adenylation domain-containing protein